MHGPGPGRSELGLSPHRRQPYGELADRSLVGALLDARPLSWPQRRQHLKWLATARDQPAPVGEVLDIVGLLTCREAGRDLSLG